MTIKQRPRNIPFRTNRTVIRFLASMMSHVDIQTALLRKTFIANLARERFFFRVHHPMGSQKVLGGETFATNIALKRLLSGVGAHVVSKARLGGNVFAAYVANVDHGFARVRFHVNLVRLYVGQHFAADVA